MTSVYDSVSTSLVGDLLNYALTIGLAAVAYAYFRRSLLDEGWSSSVDLWRHLSVFFCISLFVLFVSTTYEIESARQDFQRDGNAPLSGDADLFLFRIRLLLLLPIDLVGVFLAACLFAVLMSYATARKNWSTPSHSTVKEVLSLLTTTALWHLTMISWWVVYGYTDQEALLPYRVISTHAAYLAIEVIALAAGVRLMSNDIARRNVGALASTLSIFYCGVLISFYCIRLWDYSLRFYSQP